MAKHVALCLSKTRRLNQLNQVAFVAAGLLLGNAAQAETYFWNTTTINNFNSGPAWSDNATMDGTTGTVPGSGDTAVFNQSTVNGNLTASVTANINVAGFIFNNTGTTLFSQTANRTTLIGSGGILVNPGAGAVTLGQSSFSLGVTVGSNQTWTNNSSSTLNIRNAFKGADGSAQTLTLAGSGSGQISFSNAVNNGASGGVLTLVIDKTGGSVSMAGGGSYSGGTTIKSGTVSTSGDLGASSVVLGDIAGSANATLSISVSITNNVTVQEGTTGTLTLNNGSTSARAFNGTLAVNNNLTLTNTGGGLFSIAGDVTLGTNVTITASGATTISGAIGDGGMTYGITKTGTSALTLSNANTYAGATTINRGTVILDGSINSSSALALGGGTLSYTKAGTNTQTFNGTTVNAGFSAVTNATATNTVELGALGQTVGGVLNISSLAGATTTASAVDSTGILGTWATVENGTSLKYAAGGGGGAITAYTGTAAATAAGVTDTTGAVNYDVAAVGTLGAGASFNTLRYTGAAGTIAGNFSANGLMNAGTGTVTYSGNVTIGANKELIILGNTQQTILSGKISDNGGGQSSLTYGGPSAGILTLSGANEYTGNTFINSGTLRVANSLAVGNVTIAGGATLNVDNSTVTLNGNLTGEGQVTKTNNSSTLTLNGNNDHKGGTTLTDGTLVLGTGTNNGLGTGTLTHSAGTLRSADNDSRTITNTLSFGSNGVTYGAAQGAATGLGDLTFTDSGSRSVGGSKSWSVHNATTATFNNSWTGNAGWNVTKAGTGTLVFNGGITTTNTVGVVVNAGTLALNGASNTYAGATSVNGGKLLINGAKTGSGAVSVSAGGTLGGGGSVAGAFALNAGGAIAPGNSIDTLTIGSATWNGETFVDGNEFAQMKFELSNTPGQGLLATSDRLAITLDTGVLTKGTGDVFKFDFQNTGAAGNTYTLLTFGSLAGGFSAGNVTPFSYTGLTGGLTGTFNLSDTALTFLVVPEPSSLAMILGGFGLFLGRRPRRQR